MKNPYERPMDPRPNIFGLNNPRFFLKKEYTMKQYRSASPRERRNMLDWSNEKWNEWCNLWGQIAAILKQSNGDMSAIPNELSVKFHGLENIDIYSISDLLNK